jgi:hypothetical protein
MIVIGADVHMSTHALAAVDASQDSSLPREKSWRESNAISTHCGWAHALDRELVWAIEDSRDLSQHLEQALIAAGERVACRAEA